MPGSTPRDHPSPEEERIAPRPIGAASAVALLLASALSSALAPLVLADSYDWVRHTTSEAGGQGVEGAWLARGGFVLFGLAVLHVVGLNRERWHAMAGFCHRFFAVAMIAVAAFSLRSWEDGAAYDRIEDLLHSVAATAMGFAFAFGVAAVGSVIVRNGGRVRVLDVTAALRRSCCRSA